VSCLQVAVENRDQQELQELRGPRVLSVRPDLLDLKASRAFKGCRETLALRDLPDLRVYLAGMA